MSTNEPTNKAPALTTEEIKRRRQDRLAAAVTPQGSGYSGRREVYREPQQPIDWRLWRNLVDVALWEACLLSLNINPTGAEQRSNDWTGYGDCRSLKLTVFPSDALVEEYKTRLRLLESNRGNDMHFSVPVRKTPERMNRVYLPEFAAWALHIGIQDMPPELITLTVKPRAVPEVPHGDTRNLPKGTATAWTKERKETARKRLNELRGQGIKAFAAQTAKEFNVTPARLRLVLADTSKAKKSAKYWST